MTAPERAIRWPTIAAPAPMTAGLALAAVAAVTGFISYTHICALTLELHQSWKTAHLMPFAVDGQIVVGSVVLLAGRGRTAWWGWLGIVPGLAESLFANWESGIAHGLLAAVWATVPAQAFAGSTFMFERWLKAQLRTASSDFAAVPASAPVPVPVPAMNGHGTEAERLFAGELAAGDVPSIRRIRAALHVGQERARQVQAHLETLTPAGRDIARIRAEIRQDTATALTTTQ